MSLSEKTLADLEWGRILQEVADRCVSNAGKTVALALPLASTREGAQTAAAEVREAVTALERGEPIPICGVRDVDTALARLRASAVLAPSELRDFASTLGAARTLRRWLATRKSWTPALARVCDTDPSLDEVEDELTEAFDPDGTLADHASPRLRELRQEHRHARARLVSRLEELMRRYAPILQDAYYTEREGRYVLPVRTDAHERFPGIVHATSGSGNTLFVEPRALVPFGNRLKVLEGEVRREEEAIYGRLSSLLAEKLPSVIAAVVALAHADVRAAIATLARDAKLSFAELVDEPVLDLRAARHPILVLDGAAVVPSDLLARGGRAVVISGPNAGGKTVALKTMGLAALMLRAGMPLPCAEGSKMGLFDPVLTDVGDDQSLGKNLSTFSAHVQNLARILDDASGTALVLLDEIATGTDPREGEALAAAVLDGLCARGAAVVATTHYEGLKALALADERFTNASVGFDVETMSPTFQLAMGIPGRSSALAVAKRYGVPDVVLDRARRFLSHEERDFETLVERLHDERRALELARRAAEEAKRSAEARERDLEAEIEALREKRQLLLRKETDSLLASVRRARDDLRAAQARLRGKIESARELRDVAKIVDDVAGKVALGGELDPTPPPPEAAPIAENALRRGLRVFVPRLRAEAEIVDLLPNGQLRVAAGPLKLTIYANEARASRVEPPPKKEPSAPKAESPRFEAPFQTKDNTCDLRGLRADDATALAEQFLDRSITAGRRVAFLVHGHGTGALREAIRGTLANSSYVAKLRPASASEGGEGVTIVWLR